MLPESGVTRGPCARTVSFFILLFDVWLSLPLLIGFRNDSLLEDLKSAIFFQYDKLDSQYNAIFNAALLPCDSPTDLLFALEFDMSNVTKQKSEKYFTL